MLKLHVLLLAILLAQTSLAVRFLRGKRLALPENRWMISKYRGSPGFEEYPLQLAEDHGSQLLTQLQEGSLMARRKNKGSKTFMFSITSPAILLPNEHLVSENRDFQLGFYSGTLQISSEINTMYQFPVLESDTI